MGGPPASWEKVENDLHMMRAFFRMLRQAEDDMHYYHDEWIRTFDTIRFIRSHYDIPDHVHEMDKQDLTYTDCCMPPFLSWDEVPHYEEQANPPPPPQYTLADLRRDTGGGRKAKADKRRDRRAQRCAAGRKK